LFSDSAHTKQARELAGLVKTPTLIIHGLRDEVALSAESSKFVSCLNPDVIAKYVTLPEESHIFQTEQAWKTCLIEAEHFLIQNLLSRFATASTSVSLEATI
jgi:dipeptidyl aminopeptidase/acylaminoacyl peptidase